MLRASDLRLPYGLAPGFAIDFEAGTQAALIGPNGAGKSTLLRALAGLIGGGVELGGEPLSSRSRRRIAQQLAFVPQLDDLRFDFTVREAVTLGRHPHRGPFSPLGEADRAQVDRALEHLDLETLAERSVLRLSGGERQRVRVARALAQAPRVLLLDEPTAHLDLGHAADLLRRVTALRDLTVVCVLHDLNLAALWFPRVVLLDAGRIVADGRPAEVLEPERVASVYGARVQVHRLEDGTPQLIGVRSGGSP